MKQKVVAIIGAGPAGLAAGCEFVTQNQQKKFKIYIFEMSNKVGGIAKTLEYKGYKFDIGGHRFYTKFSEIKRFYQEFLGSDFLKRDRLSRIYYGKKFYSYPISAPEALANLGIKTTIKIVASWFKRQIFPYNEENFSTWVSNRFGDELFNIFFKSYTEKVWGIPTSELSADWAIQRIQNFNLYKAAINSIIKKDLNTRTIIKSFYYPKYGQGVLYEKLNIYLQKQSIKIFPQHQIIKLFRRKSKIETLLIKDIRKNKTKKFHVDYVISTMPFNELILRCDPPYDLLKAVKKLKFRNLICVYLIVKYNPFKDQWIYIHDPTVYVGRIQNFRNWSPYMVKKDGLHTPIAMEYFTNENGMLWNKRDSEMIKLAHKEITSIGLVSKEDIVDTFVYRAKNVYPLYNYDYKSPLELAKSFVNKIENLFPCGRGGLFRYNNQDHSILTGFYAARNVIAGQQKYNVWEINEQMEYLESK